MHGKDRPAFVLERLENVDDRLFRCRVDARKGFVQQVEVRPLRQRPGEEDALLLPARQLADLAVREISHADPVETVHGQAAVTPGDPAQQAKLTVKPHLDHVDHAGREIPIDAGPLRDIGDPAALLAKRFAIDRDLPRQGRHDAQNRLEQGRFARPVRPDDRRHRPGFDPHIGGKDRGAGAVGHGQATHLQGKLRICHGQIPAASLPIIPRSGGVPPRARAMVVTLWSIMPG